MKLIQMIHSFGKVTPFSSNTMANINAIDVSDCWAIISVYIIAVGRPFKI